MRRYIVTAFVLFLSVLSALGGSGGIVLCLHEVGGLHFESTLFGEREAAEGDCDKNPVDACGSKDAHGCDWCIDVAVDGIDVAQLSRGDVDDFRASSLEFAGTVAVGDWAYPLVDLPCRRAARAPPAAANGLIVVETSVLLI